MRIRLVVAFAAAAMFSALPASAQGLGWASEALTPPSGEEVQLLGVSCAGTSFCVTVGPYESGEFHFDSVRSSWNGSSWSSLSSFGYENDYLYGVSCTSSSFCVAVGSYGSLGFEETFAQHWNGTKWSLVSTPNPGLEENSLEGVSCTSSSACTAVGERSYENETLAIRWNGSSWSTQTTPSPGTGNNDLHGVSCTSSTHCVAVGDKVATGGSETTLAMTWNGTSWTTQTTPNPTGALSSSVEAVSCTSSTACIAVGVYQAVNGPLPFAMQWNGTSWSLQSVKLPSKTNFGWLNGVSCTASNACIAVGSYELIGTGTFTMAQKWDGSNWTAEKPANPGASFNSLDAVSCAASNWCKAAGYYVKESKILPFLEHFSG